METIAGVNSSTNSSNQPKIKSFPLFLLLRNEVTILHSHLSLFSSFQTILIFLPSFVPLAKINDKFFPSI